MSAVPAFEALVGRLDAGDPGAAAQIFHRFKERLIGLASTRLGRALRPKAEPEDVVQSVFRSFFTRQRQGQFTLHGWDGLWDVLVVITLRKCCNRAAFLQAARRDVRRETSLQAAGGADPLAGALAHERDPAAAVELAETVERLLQAFAERERGILRLALQGYAVAEIGAQVGCSERKVYRVLERVRVELQRMQDETAEAAA